MEEIYEEKELFETKVKYTKSEYLKLRKFHMHVIYCYYHIIIYALIFTIFSVNIYMEKALNFRSIMCIIAFVVYTVLIYFMPYIYNHFNLRKNSKSCCISPQFKIYSTYIASRVNDKDQFYIKPYSELYKVYETKHTFYLYISKTNAYIIPKKKITGNISNFRRLLIMNCRKKYERVF